MTQGNGSVVVEQKKSEVFDTRTVVKKLENLMTEVTKEKATPDTVSAACNCAARITDILRIHLEVERLKGRGR